MTIESVALDPAITGALIEMATDHPISDTDKLTHPGSKNWLKTFISYWKPVEKWVGETYPSEESRRAPVGREEDLSFEAALNRLGVTEAKWHELNDSLTPAEKIAYGTTFLIARACRNATETWSGDDWMVLVEAQQRVVDQINQDTDRIFSKAD